MIEDRELSIRQTYLLKQFVDRKSELSRFRELLNKNDRILFVVTGESAIGKSAFMARMIHECRESGWHRALVPCDLMTNVDYRAVMRKLKSEIGSNYFEKFDQEDKKLGEPIFQLTIEGDVSVGERAKFTNSTAGDLVGVQVNFPERGLNQWEKERRSTLTYRFIEGLKEVVADNRIVIFFDAVEKMTQDVEEWVMNELIVAAITGDLLNVKFVQCGQRRLKINEEIEFAIEETTLGPLGERDIVEYLEKRGISGEDVGGIASVLMNQTRGFAGEIAKRVDAYAERLGR